eukprot:scaffold23291_cov63-Phaeocystis_antarctica.AAC.1
MKRSLGNWDESRQLRERHHIYPVLHFLQYHRCRTHCSARNPKVHCSNPKVHCSNPNVHCSNPKVALNALVRATFGLLQFAFGLLQCIESVHTAMRATAVV